MRQLATTLCWDRSSFTCEKEMIMSSIDQENLRRAEREIRNSVGSSNEGSGAMWFLVVVVVAAVVGGIYVYSADRSGVPAIEAPAPASTEEIAPTVAPTE
jgi:hypothetical protein